MIRYTSLLFALIAIVSKWQLSTLLLPLVLLLLFMLLLT